MQIKLSPQRRNGTLSVRKAGDILVINDEFYNFSSLPDGATIPASDVPCDWIAGPVERVAGELRLTLILPHGPNPSQAVAFAAPIVDPPDGVIALPFDPPAEEQDDVDA